MLLGSLPAMNAAIVCDGKDLETYNVKQDGTSSLAAFVSSEAGKVSAILTDQEADHRGTNSFCLSNSKSLSRSIRPILRSVSLSSSTGGLLSANMCEPGRDAQGYIRAHARSYPSSSKNVSSSVRLFFCCLCNCLLMCAERARL